MTEDTSPENLRKFIESDDPAMVRMGLSMAKGSGVPEELYNIIFGLSLWNPEQEIREVSGEIVKKIGIENISEFQLPFRTSSSISQKVGMPLLSSDPDILSSNFQDWLYDNLEIFESAIKTLKNIGDIRSVGLLIEILALIPVNSRAEEIETITNALGFESGDPVWLEDTRALEPLIRIVDNFEKIEWEDNTEGWGPTFIQIDFVCWAIEALGRIGDTRAIESLMNTFYWDDAYTETGESYTRIFTLEASEALARILLKFVEGIPVEHEDVAYTLADTLIWLIRVAEEDIEAEEDELDEWIDLSTREFNEEEDETITSLYDTLEALSKLAEIGWDDGDYVTGLCGWDPEFFSGELNGDEFDLKALLSNR